MAGPIKIAILANGSQAKREIGQVETTLGKIGGAGKKAALLGFGALTYGAVAFAKSSVDIERQFSTSMRLIQASTKAPAGEMKQLNDLAVKLGADTSFSANDAADAMLELAKAGLDTKTIMGGGVAGTLTLAAAGGTDLASAATIASNAMNTFNLRGKDMDSVAAALAGGANASTASVESLGQALQQVGPGATNAGLSLQETIAALSVFDQAGIKGSDAGTSLKTMLTRLVPSTEAASTAMDDLGLKFTNSDGSFKSLAQISQQLKTKMSGLSAEQRTLALNTIFGSDASRAATVLMKEGSAGIRDFIKATKDQNAAQEMAQARMSGTEGALEKLSGAIETAQLRIGQELAPVVIAGADAFSDKLVPAIETGIDAAKDIANALAPAASEIAEALGHLGGEADGVGNTFENVFIPALKTASEIVGGLVDFVDNLPGPVKEIGVQAGFAALILPRFTGAVAAGTTAIQNQITYLRVLKLEMTDTATRSTAVTGAMSRMAGAAKTAAGIGGLLALTHAMTDASTETTGFEGALDNLLAGGLLGLSVGGPAGAAVGVVGGLATSFKDLQRGFSKLLGVDDEFNDLYREAGKAKENMDAWKASVESLVSTFDRLSGAITGATRVEALRQFRATEGYDKIENALNSIGVTDRTISQGLTGDAGAMRIIMKQAKGSELALAKLGVPLHTVEDAFGDIGLKVKAAGKQTREAIRVTEDLGFLYKILPKKVATKIDQRGIIPATRDIAKLTRQYNLTPKQIRTIIRETDAETTMKKVRKLIAQLKAADNTKVSLKGFTTGIKVGAATSAATAKSQTKAIIKNLEDVQKAKPNLTSYVGGVKSGVSNAKGAAGGSVAVGVALKQGLLNGAYGVSGALSAILAGAVRSAIAAAKREAQSHSPSRKTMELGRNLGEGLNIGLASTNTASRKGGKDAITKILNGMQDGASGARSAINDINALIRKQIDLKDSKKEKAAEKRAIKSLGKQYDLLIKNGKAQDALNKKLEKAQAKLQEIQQWADQVKQTFIDTGNITSLGVLEDGTVSSTAMLDQLRGEVNDAKEFAAIIRELTDDTGVKLNATSLQQLLDAGPEAGLATAEALRDGGDAALKEINSLTAELAAAGSGLAYDMSKQFFDIGLKAAEGIVKGLRDDQGKLDKVAEQLAKKLAAAVRKALKINSPSKVFTDIGGYVVDGLAIGLDDTRASRAGTVLAGSLVKGFGTPYLDAYASTSASSDGSEIKIHLTADVITAIQQGKAAQATITAGRRAGVRQLAVTS